MTVPAFGSQLLGNDVLVCWHMESQLLAPIARQSHIKRCKPYSDLCYFASEMSQVLHIFRLSFAPPDIASGCRSPPLSLPLRLPVNGG